MASSNIQNDCENNGYGSIMDHSNDSVRGETHGPISDFSEEEEIADEGHPTQYVATQAYSQPPHSAPSLLERMGTEVQNQVSTEPQVADKPTWYADCPEVPDLYCALSLKACREECKEWARKAGFNLIQKKADKDNGNYVKATFVCGCKGRKAPNRSNHALEASALRAKSTVYAKPGEEMCPFQ